MAEEKFDLAGLKKVGMIQQKQLEYFAMRLRAVAGDLTTKQLKKIAEVADKYGKGEVHLSTRQGVEIHNMHHSNLEKARLSLEETNIKMGACGPRVRVIIACPGSATCKWGIIETKKIAHKLDAKYFRKDTPHKFEMSVTGCLHNCAKATENDAGEILEVILDEGDAILNVPRSVKEEGHQVVKVIPCDTTYRVFIKKK